MVFRARFGPMTGSVNLVIPEGETCARIREMLNPAFHYVSLRSLVSTMSKETSVVIDRWVTEIENKSFDVQIHLHALSLAIVASSSFSMNTTGDLTAQICQLLSQLLQKGFDAVSYRTNHFSVFQTAILSQLPIWRKQTIDKNAAILRTLVKAMINDRKSGKTHSNCQDSDLLDLLLTAEAHNGNKFSDEQVENETIAFLSAGRETTETLLTRCIYVLLTYSDVFYDCRQEVDPVLSDEAPSYEHLHVIDAVVHETLRLYPPVSMVMRQCVYEDTIGKGKLRIPVGTGI